MPTQGPFSRTWSANGPIGSPGGNPSTLWYRQDSTWYRQRRPYNLPLWYQSYRGRVIGGKWTGVKGDVLVVSHATGYDASSFSTSYDGYTRAWNKFRSAVSDNAQIGLMFAERKQSMSMIESRTLQFYRFTRAISRFRFGDAADALGVSRKELRQLNLRSGSRSFANNVLEFQFGWAPTVNDIYGAAKVLSKDVDIVRARGRGRGSKTITETYSEYYYGGARKDYRKVTVLDTLYLLGADVRVSNPNLALAENLGLVNPALFLYERVPFSFVLNWFVTLEEFLSSFTAFWGYQIDNPFTTSVRLAKTNLVQTHVGPTIYYDGQANVNMERFWMNRVPGAISGPPLRLREPWVLSPSRGLNAVALLLQRLKSH